MPSPRPLPWSRRQFLAQFGLVGAAVLMGRPAAAVRVGPGHGPLPAGALDPAADALHTLARDTYRGLAVWVVPGPDQYSRAQGEVSPTPGGVEAAADEFLLQALDSYLPMPDEFIVPVVRALATGAASAPAPLVAPAVADGDLASLDDRLQALLAGEGSVPISLLIAMLLNSLAVQVTPAALTGPFPASPYANLTHRQKTEAFRRLEEDSAQVAAHIDGELSEPMRRAFSGVLGLLGGSLPNFAAFAVYSEYHAFDRERRVARTRPIGWDLSNFAPGRRTPPDGWAEFRGYHKGLR